MRICRFDDGRVGVVRGTAVHDVTAVVDDLPRIRWPFPREDLFVAHLDSLRPRMEALANAAPAIPLGSVRLLSPVGDPGKIIGAPINYAAHTDEARQDALMASGRPITSIGDWGVFLKAGTSLVGPGEGVVLRFPERRTDHEVELAVVIGRGGSAIPQAEASGHIAGYCIGLDITLRGSEFQCLRKSPDSYAVLGPWLVTPDEFGPHDDVPLRLSVNGEPRQESSTRHLVWSVERLIEYASSFYTLLPGDVIMTGTPAGVGPVTPGDRIEAECGGIGSMTVLVRAEGGTA